MSDMCSIWPKDRLRVIEYDKGIESFKEEDMSSFHFFDLFV